MDRGSALLSMQRALWGEVTPDLRGVAVSWRGDEVRAVFLFDHPVGEQELDTVSCVETEVIADCDPSETEFRAQYLPVADRRELPDGGDWGWVYLRRERT